jgi:hypothetical protein
LPRRLKVKRAKLIFSFVAVVFLGLSSLAMADSISPTTFSGSGPTGSSYTVNKTVTISKDATTSLVDVFFLADTTGSMYGTITAVQSSAASILAGTTGFGDVRWGVGEYKDFGDSYAYRLNTGITATTASVTAGINAWAASGGGDYQEANLYALNSLATDAATGWRAGSAKILVWFGDASGHDPSGGITEAIATNALKTMGIKAEAIDVGSMNDTGQAQRIATATGGAYFSGINSSTIVDTILAAITASITNYKTVGIDTSEVPAGVGVSVTPGSYTGTFDRSIDRTFDFSVTFTDLEVGTHTFNVYATVDGGRVATETDTITSTAVGVPEPGLLLLLGSGFVALIGLRRKFRG